MFWHLTLREIAIVLSGAAKRIEREQLFNDQVAYKVGQLVSIGVRNPKKFPSFDKVSSVKKRRKGNGKRQSWQDQKAMAQVFNAMYGGKVET